MCTTATEWAATADEAGGDAPLDREPPAQRGLFEEEATTRPATRTDATVSVVDVRGPHRPGGARFGELVHAVLASAPLDADRSRIEDLADMQGRILSAPPEEVAAAAGTVGRVFCARAPRARASGRRGACRRETPVTCTRQDGALVELIEGIVDLAFEEEGRWTVVDYKTDRELAASGEERYRRQVGLYASAIAQATGAPASGVLVRI